MPLGESVFTALTSDLKIRVKSDRLVIVGDGAVEVAFGRVCVAPVEVGPGVPRVESDRLVVVGDGTVVLLLVIAGQASIEVGPGVRGVVPDRLPVIGDGAIDVARDTV